MSIRHTGKSIKDQLRDFRAITKDLPNYIGTEAVRFFKDSFNRQGFIDKGGVQKWKARSPKAKRNKGRKILIDRAVLKRSIRITNKSNNSVTVGTNVPYAKVHNEGFRGVQHVRPHKRVATVKAKWKNSYTGRNVTIRGRGRRHNVRGFGRRMNMPQRQFIGQSAFFDRRIQKQIGYRVKQALGTK